MDGEGGRDRVSGIDPRGDGVPIHRQSQGPADLAGAAGALLGVEAQIEQVGGGVVPGLVVAAVAHGVGGHQVHIHQRHLPRVEGVDQLVALVHRMEGDGADGQGRSSALPPAAPGGEGQLLPLGPQGIGPGAWRPGPVAQGDRDVQQEGQGAIGPPESDRDLIGGLWGGSHRGDVGQPGPKAPLGGPGQIQGVGHGLSGEGGPVGEGDPRLQGEGPHQRILTDGIAAAEHRLGLKSAVHREKRLVQQGGQGQVGTVGGQGGVEAELRVNSQGEGDRRRGRGLLLAGISAGGGGLGRACPSGTGGEGDGQGEEEGGDMVSFHVGSFV